MSCMYPESTASHRVPRNSKKDIPAKRSVVGVVVFDGEKFLLLHRVLNWSGWEYPKGGIEDGEDIAKAIGRELFEETGIPKYELVQQLDKYVFRDTIHNREVFMQNYLVRVSSNTKITFDHQALKDGEKLIEHDDYKWCFPAEAIKLLTHGNSKRTMKRAIKVLGVSKEK